MSKKEIGKGNHFRTEKLLILENIDPLISLTQAVSVKV